MTRLAAMFDRTIDLLAWLAAFLLVFAMLSVTADVVSRKFFERPIIWVFDITQYILLYVTFLGTAWLLKRDGHIVIDIAIAPLGPRARAFLGIVSSIVGVAVCAIIVWYGTQVTLDHFQRAVRDTALLQLPKAPLLAIIPFGSLLLMVQFMRRAYGFLGQRNGSAGQDAARELVV